MVFPADMLRDSYETIEVRNNLNDSLYHEDGEEDKSSELSFFDKINIIDFDKTIRAKSYLTGSEFRLNLTDVASGLELDDTIRLSIEHCINFDLNEGNAILRHFNH